MSELPIRLQAFQKKEYSVLSRLLLFNFKSRANVKNPGESHLECEGLPPLGFSSYSSFINILEGETDVIIMVLKPSLLKELSSCKAEMGVDKTES